jgi:hypothetical protein
MGVRWLGQVGIHGAVVVGSEDCVVYLPNVSHLFGNRVVVNPLGVVVPTPG